MHAFPQNTHQIQQISIIGHWNNLCKMVCWCNVFCNFSFNCSSQGTLTKCLEIKTSTKTIIQGDNKYSYQRMSLHRGENLFGMELR